MSSLNHLNILVYPIMNGFLKSRISVFYLPALRFIFFVKNEGLYSVQGLWLI